MSPFAACAVGIGLSAVLWLACLWLARWLTGDSRSRAVVRAGGVAKRLDASDGGEPNLLEFELVQPSSLRAGDLVACWAGDVVPASGTVIEGSAELATVRLTRPVGHTVARGRRVARGAHVVSGYVLVRLTHGAATTTLRAVASHHAPLHVRSR